MVIKRFFNNILRKSSLPAVVAAIMSLTACDSMINEPEGECVVTYNLRFVYNMNLKWADAFPSEVHSVHLYAFNSNGVFVKDYVVNGDVVDQEDYTMQLDLNPGKYTLLAWCGLNNLGVSEQSFTVPTPVAGQTRIEELTCALNVKQNATVGTYSDAMLNFMYHGMLDVDLPDVYNGDYYYTMYLTKDTNHMRIILQQLSNEDMVPEDFEFKIEDANRMLGFDNSLISNDVVTYLPWDVIAGEAGMLPDGEDKLVYSDGLIADLSTNRLMASHKEDFMLTITSEDKIVARVPLLQYALLSKDYYVMAYGHEMSDQEFLDREDEYIFTFFLDDSKRWVEMHIQIQSWRMVIHNYEM